MAAPTLPDSVYDVDPNDADAAAAYYEANLVAKTLRPEDVMILLHMQDDDNGRAFLKRVAEIVERTGIKPPRPRGA